RVLEIEDLGTAADDDEVDDAERRLHLRQPEELVEDDVRISVFFQLDRDRHALAIAVVLDVAHALESLVANELGDLGDEARLVDLVRNLRDDDLFAVALAELLHLAARAHD